MSTERQIAICQQCGRGFILTKTYREFLARRDRKILMPVLCPTCYRKVGPQPKRRGEVKWFSPRRHYGFIITEEGEEIFFHEQQIFEGEETPHEGQTAVFHLRYSAKGPEALNVEVLKE